MANRLDRANALRWEDQFVELQRAQRQDEVTEEDDDDYDMDDEDTDIDEDANGHADGYTCFLGAKLTRSFVSWQQVRTHACLRV